jgi:hypothetical protein
MVVNNCVRIQYVCAAPCSQVNWTREKSHCVPGCVLQLHRIIVLCALQPNKCTCTMLPAASFWSLWYIVHINWCVGCCDGDTWFRITHLLSSTGQPTPWLLSQPFLGVLLSCAIGGECQSKRLIWQVFLGNTSNTQSVWPTFWGTPAATAKKAARQAVPAVTMCYTPHMRWSYWALLVTCQKHMLFSSHLTWQTCSLSGKKTTWNSEFVWALFIQHCLCVSGVYVFTPKDDLTKLHVSGKENCIMSSTFFGLLAWFLLDYSTSTAPIGMQVTFFFLAWRT